MSTESASQHTCLTSGTEPKGHLVASPERAVKKFTGEAVLKGLGGVLNILALGIFGLFFLAIAGDSEGFRIVGFICLGLGGLSFIASQHHMEKGFKLAKAGLATPERGAGAG